MSGRLFRGGVPTGPDVDRLMALKLSPGDRVAFEDVERLIGVRRDQSRFRTVTNSWRSRLFREQRLQIEAAGGIFRVLTADEAVSSGIRRMNGVGRAAGRTVTRVEAIDAGALTPARLQHHTLLRRHAGALLGAAQEACKAVAAPRAVTGKTLRLARNNDD